MNVDPAAYFANYTRLPRRLPPVLWWPARGLAFVATLAVIATLALAPKTGLRLFWGVLVPSLPLVFLVAPGLWRQVCPMALMNQLPRALGVSRARDLPRPLAAVAFTIALVGFVGAVALRKPLLNQNGAVVAAVLVAALVLPLLGGLVFKGRSGWCGTFCPLGPIQRVYGQAPVVVVPNGYCAPCLGCQKTCYDFNPRAAFFSDIDDDDPRYAGQRRFFMGFLPGLVLGYFLQAAEPSYGPFATVGIILGACLASAGLFDMVVHFWRVRAQRAANAFGAIALTAFYSFVTPTLLTALGELLGVPVAPGVAAAGSVLGPLLGVAMLVQGWRSDARFRAMKDQTARPTIDPRGKSLESRLSAGGGAEIQDLASGASFVAKPEQTLLEALESAGIKINFGCRAGICGADAVVISEGMDNLSPASEDEVATLQRLGLHGKARLACVCQVKGPVAIDRNPGAAARPAAAAAAPAEDRAKAAGLERVVVLGNGVAGMGAAEALRRNSPSLKIDVVTEEPLHFYNRMALGRVIYGRTGMDGLHLLPDNWYGDNNVEVWRNTLAVAIDRQAKQVRLGTGEALPYDRLVIATGARAATPEPDFLAHPNAFALRTAADAQGIRLFIQNTGAKTAVVIGGGVLGVEAADALRHLGLGVTLLHRGGWLMDKQLDVEGAIRLTSFLRDIGIKVRTNARIDRFLRDAKLLSAELSTGESIAADVFVSCIGLVANSGLAREAGLTVKRGIVVDSCLRTSDPDIYAIGDVAEVPGALGGLWPIAQQHATTAVDAIFGDPKPLQTRPVILQLKSDGIDLRSYGEIELGEGSYSLRAMPGSAAWWRLTVRDEAVVGGVYVGPPGTSKAVTRLFKSGGDRATLIRELQSAGLEAKQ
jgi:NADPH-dependent 2,4-dienoyl-CoA reductase/sulfur reductase-like enzyme/ferredoxin